MKCKHCGAQSPGLSHYCTMQCRILHNVVEDENGCWIWQLSFNTQFYPCIRINEKTYRGNRLAYEAFHGPIPDGMLVRHRCHNTKCLNPLHLVAGSYFENTEDSGLDGRHISMKLTREQVRAIRGDSRHYRIIAADYQISDDYVYRIKSRATWKEI
jgi:hypothetical protein